MLEEKVLEEPQKEPVILIVESVKENTFYAIEKAQQGIYALCALGSWITIRSFDRLDRVPRPSVPFRTGSSSEPFGDPSRQWWRAAAIEPRDHYAKDSRTPSRPRSWDWPRLNLKKPQAPDSLPCSVAREQSPSIVQSLQKDSVQTIAVLEPFQGPDEIFDTLKSQYQDSLYTSKVIY